MAYDESKETPRDVIRGMRLFVERERLLDISCGNPDAGDILEAMYGLILSYARRLENALDREDAKKVVDKPS